MFDAWLRDVRRETLAQLSNRYQVEFPEQALEGDWTNAGVRRQLDTAYADPNVTAVFGFGLLTSQVVATHPRLPKPTLLPFVMEGGLVGLPQKGAGSGKRNLTYISERVDLPRNIERLKQVSGAKRIAVLVDATQKPAADAVIARDKVAGLSVVVADDNAAQILSAIPHGTEAVVIALLPRLGLQERTRLLQGLGERRLASVAAGGPEWVAQGALMTLRTQDSFDRRASRAALNLSLILEGRRPSALHVAFESRDSLLINLAVALAIDVRPGFDVLAEAELLEGTEATDTPPVGLGDIMKEALQKNLALVAERKGVEATAQGVKIARGALLPQAGLELGVVQIDPDRAFPFVRAERQAEWSARAQQLLYSERAWTDFTSFKHFYAANEYGYLSERLNTMLEAGVAYVNVLRSQTAESIQRENLKETRENLELARQRVDAGVANKSEVYRWEIEVADKQRSAVDIGALKQQARIELNRILYRPSEQRLVLSDVEVNADASMRKFLGDPWSFAQFRNFMVQEGLGNSPEAKQIAKLEQAAKRTQQGRNRELWLPEFALRGGVSHEFWRDGAGESAPAGSVLPEIDHFGWDVGAFASIPLSAGGSRVAEARRSARELERLQAERARIAQEIDTGVRSELHAASAAATAVRLTERAAKAAQGNLDLVRDLYRQGSVDIITLVDAQSRRLIADLRAVDARYDLLIAILRVDRASGHFRYLDSPAEQTAFYQRVEAFFSSLDGEAN